MCEAFTERLNIEALELPFTAQTLGRFIQEGYQVARHVAERDASQLTVVGSNTVVAHVEEFSLPERPQFPRCPDPLLKPEGESRPHVGVARRKLQFDPEMVHWTAVLAGERRGQLFEMRADQGGEVLGALIAFRCADKYFHSLLPCLRSCDPE